jgi:hypothetical protein
MSSCVACKVLFRNLGPTTEPTSAPSHSPTALTAIHVHAHFTTDDVPSTYATGTTCIFIELYANFGDGWDNRVQFHVQVAVGELLSPVLSTNLNFSSSRLRARYEPLQSSYDQTISFFLICQRCCGW